MNMSTVSNIYDWFRYNVYMESTSIAVVSVIEFNASSTSMLETLSTFVASRTSDVF